MVSFKISIRKYKGYWARGKKQGKVTIFKRKRLKIEYYHNCFRVFNITYATVMQETLKGFSLVALAAYIGSKNTMENGTITFVTDLEL